MILETKAARDFAGEFVDSVSNYVAANSLTITVAVVAAVILGMSGNTTMVNRL